MSYEHVARPTPKVGSACKIQGRRGTHAIVETRNRVGRVGVRVGCKDRWYSELSLRTVDDPVDCPKCTDLDVNKPEGDSQ